MAGGAHIANTRVRSPRGELARIRDAEVEQKLEVRGRIMEAMLAACGDKGFREVSIQDVIDRYGGYRLQFYRHFANKADCYAAAYDAEIERLCGHILEAAPGRDWGERLRAGLDVVARFARERPDVARGLLVEVHVAGSPALAKRQEALKRLSRAVDSARRENEAGRHSPPPITADFMIGAVESAVTSALMRGEPWAFSEAVPELAEMVIAAYFGEEGSTRQEAAAALPAA